MTSADVFPTPLGPIQKAPGTLRTILLHHTVERAENTLAKTPGTVKLKVGGGHGGHNGLRDVIRHCGADFMRLRLGVGHPGHKDEVTDYVLKNASRDDESAILRNVDEAADVMPMLADESLNAAMKKLHTSD